MRIVLSRLKKRLAPAATLLLAVYMVLMPLSGPVYGDPLTTEQLTGLNQWTNWVADSCSNNGAVDSAISTVSNGGSVFILGDSITNRSSNEYQAAFEAKGMKVTIDASDSRSLTAPGKTGNQLNGFDAITKDQAAMQDASTIVIALGTNGGNTAGNIDKAIGMLPKGKKVYWVDLVASGRTAAPANDAIVGPDNRAIYSEAASQGYNIISWFKAVDPSGNPQDPAQNVPDKNNYIDTSDGLGVHPTTAGSKALAKLVTETVSTDASTAPTAGAIAQCCSNDSGSSTALTGRNAQQKIFNYFVAQGLTPQQAAGILGNIAIESAGTFDPTIIQGGSHSNNPADAGTGGYGIVQFTGYNEPTADKVNGIIEAANIQGKPYELETQLEMIWAQLTGKAGKYSEAQAGQDIKGASSVEEAVRAWQGDTQLGGKYTGYERPSSESATLPDRIAAANNALKEFGGDTGTNGTGVSSDTSGGTCACPATGSDNAQLSETLKTLAEKSGGRANIAVGLVEGDLRADYAGGQQVPTRNTYKLYTAYATLRAIQAGKLSWSDNITWTDTSGSGLYPGSKHSLLQTFEAMIVHSNNDAATALRTNDTIGTPAEVTKMLQDDVGLSNKTVMGSGGPSNSNSQSTANDFVSFLLLLQKQKLPGVTDSDLYDKLFGFMKQSTTDGGSARDGIVKGVGGGTEVADKAGWGPDATNDVGIVYAKSPYVVAILTDGSVNWPPVAAIAAGVNAAMGGDSGAGNDTGTASGCGGAVSDNVAQTAINYSWPKYRGHPFTETKASYKNAVAKAEEEGRYVGSNGTKYAGIDCGGFVTTVMIDSGWDTTYNNTARYKGPVSTQYDYLTQSGKWHLIHPSTTKDLQEGDVWIRGDLGHTLLYVGQHDGFASVYASASTGIDNADYWRAPMADSNSASLYSDGYWFRKN